MFSWILIIFAIAVIFGVIKIEDLKAWAIKMQPKLQELFGQAKNWTEAKAAEIKAANEQKNTAEAPKKDSEDKPAE